MNLPTTNSTHYFVPVDGVIKLIPEMPILTSSDYRKNNEVMDSAIDNAIEVSNQNEVKTYLYAVEYHNGRTLEHITDYKFEDRKVYSLQCRVEMKLDSGLGIAPENTGYAKIKEVALVTFDQASEPKRTMTKEEAIQAMKEGKKVTHRYFSENEWILYDYDTLKILTEEGYRHNPIEFWSFRQGPEWEQDWELWSEPGDSEKGETQEEIPAVIKFLLGEGELDGKWFGGGIPNGKAPFWWRTELRKLFPGKEK